MHRGKHKLKVESRDHLLACWRVVPGQREWQEFAHLFSSIIVLSSFIRLSPDLADTFSFVYLV